MNVVITAICVTGIIVAAILATQRSERTEVKSQLTENGRVICFSNGQSMSCLPVWLLDRPNNWVVMYPHTTPTGKVKK